MSSSIHIRTKVARRAAIVGAATIGITPTLAPALPIAWTDGHNNATWQDLLNWNPNQVPTNADAASFPAVVPNAHATITLTAPSNAASLQFDNGYTLTGSGLTLRDGAVAVNSAAMATAGHSQRPAG